MNPNRLIILPVLLTAWCSPRALPQAADATADPAAVVTSGAARFTLLTDGLVRMEWSAGGTGEDHASLVFINRRLPVPPHHVTRNDGWLSLSTSRLSIRYRENSGRFTAENLEASFEVDGRTIRWLPGVTDSANLGGTIRTLDGVRGATPLEPGLLSRSGWTLVDDSERPLFDTTDWPWVMPRPVRTNQDWYLFVYGDEYRSALGDFIRVAGRIPIPPRFAFGLWWSRYWAYTDRELMDLVGEFDAHRVPLDVLVVDMDWHETFDLRWDTDKRDQAGQRLGWTGYTWNRAYFPDPPAFLDWCERRGVKTTLNLHPASGIQPHEEAYPAMARAMGMLPESRRYVPFDIVDKRFAEHYFTHVLRPLERQGVDFWWLDWQQWGTTTIPGVTPTWWLNYVHFTDMERQGKARPLIFHRWGGLGNHRYQIGFSGDAISVWESLQFQPAFTATAANVGFGYWSHDIGGHMPGPVSAELYTRWVQWGAFSPILRTHTTKNPAAERRFWAYPERFFRAMREAVLLRYSLVPYLYTAARQAYETGISVCRPLYYDHPRAPEAYAFAGEYMFGDRILVAPVTDSIVTGDGLARKTIWIPPGIWREWFSGALCKGPAAVEREFTLEEIPVYVKAGSVIPMQEVGDRATSANPDPLVIAIVPGDSGSTRLYEDDGASGDYERGAFSWTPLEYSESGDGLSATVVIAPAVGSFKGMKETRGFVVRLMGVLPPVRVLCNGREVVPGGSESGTSWEYVGEDAALLVRAGRHARSEKISVEISYPSPAGPAVGLLDGFPGQLARLRAAMELLNSTWPAEWSPDALVQVAQTGRRMSLNPGRAAQELETFRRTMPGVRSDIQQMQIDEEVKGRVLRYLSLMREGNE